MVQVIGPGNRRSSFGEKLNAGLSPGLDTARQVMGDLQQQRMMKQQQQTIAQQFPELAGLPPELQKVGLAEIMKQQGKQSLLQQKQGYLDQLFGGQGQSQQRPMGNELSDVGQLQHGGQEMGQGFDPSQIPDEVIARAAAVDPNIARSLQHAKDVSLREKSSAETRKMQKEKFAATEQERERSYQTSYSKEAEKKANAIRESLPKKEMSLDFARNAIESQDLSFFSPDKLADATGIDLFRTGKGAQLVTAAKENLLSNMGRVSAKGQNVWFEQRLNSMFPKIGQDKEANLTVQEMLEGETQMDRAYLKEFDRLSAEDEEKYGFVRKDIEKRARDAVKPIEKEIMQRTTYRMKEIEEQENGLQSMKPKVGKNVVKGTPLTLAMAKLYKQKFGENALDIAEKNGYYIPTIEEYQAIRSTPQEFRETIAP